MQPSRLFFVMKLHLMSVDERSAFPSLDLYFMLGILAVIFQIILVFIPAASGKMLKFTSGTLYMILKTQ